MVVFALLCSTNITNQIVVRVAQIALSLESNKTVIIGNQTLGITSHIGIFTSLSATNSSHDGELMVPVSRGVNGNNCGSVNLYSMPATLLCLQLVLSCCCLNIFDASHLSVLPACPLVLLSSFTRFVCNVCTLFLNYLFVSSLSFLFFFSLLQSAF